MHRQGEETSLDINIRAGSTAAVQATNDDASASKLSCVKKGYFHDNYVQYFVRRGVRRSPIINRGYYARWAALRKLLLQFLQGGPTSSEGVPLKKQVLSLGAGFDTTFFQLQEEGKAPAVYVELDFKEVTSKKTAIIGSQEHMRSMVGEVSTFSQENGVILAERYKLLPVDLREIKKLDEAFELAQLDPSLPTFIIAECVLIYLEPHVSCSLVKWAGDQFSTAIFVIYEQIHPDDPFGQQMIKNLECRGCPLLSLNAMPTLEAKQKLFTDSGWQKAEAYGMHTIYHKYLDFQDRKRIERLEMFDEFEEWHLMQEHYCIAYGINDGMGVFSDFGYNRA